MLCHEIFGPPEPIFQCYVEIYEPVTGILVRENFGPTLDQFSMEFWSGGTIFFMEFWFSLANISMKNASPFQNNLERMPSPSGAAVAVIRSSYYSWNR